MKKALERIVEAGPVVSVVFGMVAAIWMLLGFIDISDKQQIEIKVLQRQMEMQAVKRGDAQLTINTNTGDFEVRLKEVAP